MNILIYNDKGCSTSSVSELVSSLSLCIDPGSYTILMVNADYLITENWEEYTQLLIFPGGSARPYYTALGASWKHDIIIQGQPRELIAIGKGNQRIKEYVYQKGGNFLGICAGGYYGAVQTLFALGGDQEIIDPGALGFFEGIAEGPAFGMGKFNYASESGAKVALIDSKPLAVQALPVYFNGGCYFYCNSQTLPKEMILASYIGLNHEHTAAVIETHPGLGKAILSGVHCEFSSHATNLDIAIKDQLTASDDKRLLFFAKIINRLGIALSKEVQIKIATITS